MKIGQHRIAGQQALRREQPKGRGETAAKKREGKKNSRQLAPQAPQVEGVILLLN
jgi:hypothetical protein